MRLFRNFIRCSLVVLSCLWAVSCGPGPGDSASSTVQEARQSPGDRVLARDFAPGQLEAHYQKHGRQFGDITLEQYLARAQELLDAPVGEDVLEKTRPNGDILHYRVSTGEFAVMTARGRIRTCFKTDLRYWMRQ